MAGSKDSQLEPRIAVAGLVRKYHKPAPASPRVREQVPRGYGVQEQCLPFVAAAALGFSIPAPFSWGFCIPNDAPDGARVFRSPVNGGCRERSFYVLDDSGFAIDKNQFIVPDEMRSAIGPGPIPGLSFFDREDQQDHVKVHLPYVWRTPEGVSLLTTGSVNRPRDDGLVAVTGLVETDWYPGMINLVFKLPPWPKTVHVSAGEIIAQIIPITRELQEIPIQILEGHRKQARLAFENISLNSAVG